jgi:hypothetical protein
MLTPSELDALVEREIAATSPPQGLRSARQCPVLAGQRAQSRSLTAHCGSRWRQRPFRAWAACWPDINLLNSGLKATEITK